MPPVKAISNEQVQRKPTAVVKLQVVEIIPLFSGEGTIGEAIDSMLRQTASEGRHANRISIDLDPPNPANIDSL